MVAVLDALGAGAVQCGGSSVGTAVEVEVDGAKITLLNYNLFITYLIFVLMWLWLSKKKAGENRYGNFLRQDSWDGIWQTPCYIHSSLRLLFLCMNHNPPPH